MQFYWILMKSLAKTLLITMLKIPWNKPRRFNRKISFLFWIMQLFFVNEAAIAMKSNAYIKFICKWRDYNHKKKKDQYALFIAIALIIGFSENI